MNRGTRVFALCAMLCALAANLPAQSIYSTLTGVVSDPTEGLIVHAKVKLRDDEFRLHA